MGAQQQYAGNLYKEQATARTSRQQKPGRQLRNCARKGGNIGNSTARGAQTPKREDPRGPDAPGKFLEKTMETEEEASNITSDKENNKDGNNGSNSRKNKKLKIAKLTEVDQDEEADEEQNGEKSERADLKNYQPGSLEHQLEKRWKK